MPDLRAAGADQRSAFPHRAGVPWWGAVLIAVTATLIGFAIEAGSGHQELGIVFSLCYAVGCIAAILAVRQSGIFTAVIQPPLLLFVAVPLAYFLMHGSEFNGLKDIAISCGYPLIERFPLMLFTSAAVLLIGLARWYFAMSAPATTRTAAPARPERPTAVAGLLGKLSSVFAGNGTEAEDPGEPPARPRHGIDRTAAARRSRPARPPRERATTERRQPRRRADDVAEPRPRRDPTRRAARDADQEPPRRRPREAARESRDPRRAAPTPRREPRERRDAYREQRDPYRGEPYPPRPQRPARSSRFEPHESDRGYPSQPAHDPYPPGGPRRRPSPSGADTTHHPVSRVRYRDSRPDPDYPEGPRSRPGR